MVGLLFQKGLHEFLQFQVVDVAVDAVVQGHDGRQRALPEAGHCADVTLKSGVVYVSPSASGGRRTRAFTASSSFSEPRVWQAVPRQTMMVWRPWG